MNLEVETVDLLHVDRCYGKSRNLMIEKVLENILPKDIIGIIAKKYDFNFVIQQKKVKDYLPLIYYQNEVWLFTSFEQYSKHFPYLYQPLLDKTLILDSKYNTLIHDGWRVRSIRHCTLYKKDKDFDVFSEKYIEQTFSWKINNQLVSRPCTGESVIFKRDNKFYTKCEHYLYCSEDGKNWTKYYLQYSDFIWEQWSIFLDDIFVIIRIQHESECESNLVLLFYDLKTYVNIMQPFFVLKLGQIIGKPISHFSLLATKSNIHIIANINHNSTYFNLKF